MKYFIFLMGGTAPDLGNFYKGEIQEFNPEKVSVHVGRGTLIAVEDLSKDDLTYWLMDRGINPPDKSNKAERIKLLIWGKNPPEEKTTKEVIEDV